MQNEEKETRGPDELLKAYGDVNESEGEAVAKLINSDFARRSPQLDDAGRVLE